MNVHNLVIQEKADIYVPHGNFMIYVVTFSCLLCRQIYSMAAKTTNISVELNAEILEEIKAVAYSYQMQKSEEAVDIANYGGTIWPERSTLHTTSKITRKFIGLSVVQEVGWILHKTEDLEDPTSRWKGSMC